MNPRAEYNPDRIAVSGCATIYEDAHEHAHLDQHARRTLAWRAREAFGRHPALRWTGLGLLVACWVEGEALLLARRELRACRLWDEDTKTEAANAFGSYVEKLLTEF